MNQFVLAFPIPVAVDEIFAITENVKVAADAKTVMIPGCSVLFNVVRQSASADVLDIFKEHCELTAEEEQSLSAHKSLLFLLGNVKSMNDVEMVNVAILKMFTAGAVGVYMQQSGTAWTANEFRDTLGSGEYPMDAWINIIEGEDDKTLYTLGLATFSLPDLCISTTIEDPEEALLMAADCLFGDGIPAKSGSVIDWGEGEKYVLRQELKGLFSKDAPEYNKQGLLRILKK
ncbi:hypothetical protein [Fibrobacter sp. UWB12]|uniref:hypothetical protein n=1 Tax=Fibrobacter sp. UWB12 TaxID=1896203 RepID=UPI0009198317|nr:hypothetical protein [Fibrobacter sp. UWB12]SHK63388.1 hypothetical protein SAMN05720759_104285 [Fibrobacter sp. UWB12]